MNVINLGDCIGSPLVVDTLVGAQVSAIPEPGAHLSFAVGGLVVAWAFRRSAVRRRSGRLSPA